MVKMQGRWIEEQVSLANYESTYSYLLYGNSLFPQYVMRGYRSGEFFAKSLANYTLEYRFPIMKTYRGAGTNPIFIKQFHGAVVADGIQLDGFAYNDDLKDTTAFPFEQLPKWKSFWDVGFELKADITLGYQFPMTVYYGVYWGLDKHIQKDSPQYGLGLQL